MDIHFRFSPNTGHTSSSITDSGCIEAKSLLGFLASDDSTPWQANMDVVKKISSVSSRRATELRSQWFLGDDCRSTIAGSSNRRPSFGVLQYICTTYTEQLLATIASSYGQ
ncbi:hypothetical protein BDV39DRAFT_179897 [Aspergillus sergii]|uniref:Uncharacterized protein n=1 Tax=Aspergillus sergii TaxID=1034303 RepID=A0A5N6WZR8_9EURO|nr:hypothetical protein BDV39DRAFT_179897 [Aspergillus sergii]